MTEALTVERGSSRWTSDRPPSRRAFDKGRSNDLVPVLSLPVVRPGQLWFAELPAIEPELLPLEYRALTTANAVIYDRALAATVARFLPLGGYAEPAAMSRAAVNTISERCLHFARDGWSVARLVDPRFLSDGEQADELRRLSEVLLSRNISADLRVALFTNFRGVYEKSETQLAQIDDIVDLYYLQRSRNLTVIFDAIGSESTSRLSVASANGLAG